jgi:hypothetical protein
VCKCVLPPGDNPTAVYKLIYHPQEDSCVIVTSGIITLWRIDKEEGSNKHIIEETVRQVGYIPELYEDARSEKYKKAPSMFDVN